MKILIFLSLLVVSSSLETPELGSSTLAPTSTEITTEKEAVDTVYEEQEGNFTDSSKETESGEKDASGETNKSKRTLERHLGYGHNDLPGTTNRLHRQTDYSGQGKFRTYFSQQPLEQPTAYHQLRHYSTLRTSAASQPDYGSRQYQDRPYSTIGVSTPGPQSSSQSSPSYNSHAASSLSSYQTSNLPDSVTSEQAYYAKPSFQPLPQYRGAASSSSSSNSNVYSASSQQHSSPLFTGPPAHAPSYVASSSLASQSPYVTASAQTAPNPYLMAGGFHGSSLFYQHPGTNGLALLQNPSPYGPQFIPVIILRVSTDANGNQVLHNQGGVSHAYIPTSGLNLQTMMYPYQYQTPQYSVYPDAQQQQLLYEEGSPSESSKASYVQTPPSAASQSSQTKVNYPGLSQKKPAIPTPASLSANQQQKLRKNVIVVNEPSSQNDSGYSQYKYAYKDKI